MEEEKRQEEITVVDLDKSERLDRYLAQALDKPRRWAQEHIDNAQVFVNGKPGKRGLSLRNGDIIVLREMDAPVAPESHEPTQQLSPTAMPLKVLYEDEALVVLDKPAGLVVHPGAGTVEPTLVEGLLYHFGHRDAFAVQAGDERPGIVHRLDKDTTGLLVCAKTQEAHAKLAKQFEEKTNYREYVALLCGKMADESYHISTLIGRHPQQRIKMAAKPLQDESPAPSGWKEAHSLFVPIKHYQLGSHHFTLARVKLQTGRTHQIRVHAAYMGFPVWADPLYGPSKNLSGKLEAFKTLKAANRQMLHARLLGFSHPITNENLMFESDLPDDMLSILKIFPSQGEVS